MEKHEPYTSDLKDNEWKHFAIFYIKRSGCAWRMLPHDFPHWRLVYYYFAKWQKEGVWEKLNAALRDRVRIKAGKKKAPTAASIDSQSVKTAGQRGERGFDAGKKVLGRKRHLLVDTLGLLLAVYVHSAGIQDRDGARPLILKAWCFGWLRVIWADGGYAGQLVQWVRQLKLGRYAKLEIIRKIGPGFTLLPKRWVVERTFAWLSRYRPRKRALQALTRLGLARDYEVKTSHSTAFIYVAACRLMARRLGKSSLG